MAEIDRILGGRPGARFCTTGRHPVRQACVDELCLGANMAFAQGLALGENRNTARDQTPAAVRTAALMNWTSRFSAAPPDEG